MAHRDALPSILRRGLLSTTALLDLFGKEGAEREAIETQMRPQSVVIEHPKYGKAVIRDQKPMQSDSRLNKTLTGGTTTVDWHRLLNSKVFFWVSEDRLRKLRNARAYRDEPQLVLVLNTRRVVEFAGDRIWLCSMNSGCCVPYLHKRSPDRFAKLVDFKGNVVECAVERELHPIQPLLIRSYVDPIPLQDSAG